MPLTTTLNKIRKHKPCQNGYKKLLTYLNKTEADDELLPLSEILKSNGLSDTIWCMGTDESFIPVTKRFSLNCVKHVQHLMKDDRSVSCVEVTEKYLNGKATSEELGQARKDAANAVAIVAAVATFADDAAFAASNSAAFAAVAAAVAAFAVDASNAASNSAAFAAVAAYADDAAARQKERQWQEQEFLRLVS